ncbi:hypothetical protein [Yoonia sediminilitoris]|nr:hypothetical protein [Yoonia sediminilitoris]
MEFFVGGGFFVLLAVERMRSEPVERLHFIDMANAFAEIGYEENLVPATI